MGRRTFCFGRRSPGDLRSLDTAALEVVISDFAPHEAGVQQRPIFGMENRSFWGKTADFFFFLESHFLDSSLSKNCN